MITFTNWDRSFSTTIVAMSSMWVAGLAIQMLEVDPANHGLKGSTVSLNVVLKFATFSFVHVNWTHFILNCVVGICLMPAIAIRCRCTAIIAASVAGVLLSGVFFILIPHFDQKILAGSSAFLAGQLGLLAIILLKCGLCRRRILLLITLSILLSVGSMGTVLAHCSAFIGGMTIGLSNVERSSASTA